MDQFNSRSVQTMAVCTTIAFLLVAADVHADDSEPLFRHRIALILGDEPEMPKNAKPRTPDQLADIRKRIESGAKWPNGVQVSATLWSLLPISAPDVSSVKHCELVATPISAFALRLIEEKGLQPAPRADRLTLIRRATFDLHGA